NLLLIGQERFVAERLARAARRRILRRQQQRERAPLAQDRAEADFSAQKPRQFAADRQPQPGAAILTAGRAVGLLECLEDDLLLVVRNADPGIADRKGQNILRSAFVRTLPASLVPADVQRHATVMRELERVRQQ